jgi:N-acetylglucosamine-6-phosphate deacetylase
MNGSYIVKGGTIVLPDRQIDNALLVVRDGTIEFAGAIDSPESAAAGNQVPFLAGSASLPVEDVSGMFVLPRLVETHIHGAGGYGFEKIDSARAILAVRDFLESRGVGCFVPTVLWDEYAITNLVKAIESALLPRSVLPGIYIEGPFVSPEKRGGIGLENIRAPSVDLAKRMIDLCHGYLKTVTIAPELSGAEALYPIFEAAGVLVSLGHSNGTLDSIALPKSRYSFTHLFNAMSGIDHRGSGGLANLAFLDMASTVELNADGIHVNPACMNLVAKQIGSERLILTSDAVVAAGLPYGDYLYFGKNVKSGPDGVRYSDTGVLMGSNKLGMEIVKSYISATGVSLHAAVASMSLSPRVAGQGGAILPGCTDDIFIWNKELIKCKRPRFRASAGE